jgi:hypothetical protein
MERTSGQCKRKRGKDKKLERKEGTNARLTFGRTTIIFLCGLWLVDEGKDC